MTLDHKTSLMSLRHICSNSQQYIVWVKIIDFYFMPKIIRRLSKDHVPWIYLVNSVNISKRNFWSVICIAKNLIWSNLNAIFSIFRFFCTLRIQIFKQLYLGQIFSYHNKPYINRKLMYSAFRCCINLEISKHLPLYRWALWWALCKLKVWSIFCQMTACHSCCH